MSQSILEWALAVIGSGGLGAVMTYIVTFKGKKKLAEAEAESLVMDVELKKTDLQLEQYDYLLKACDKYIRDYHELEGDFRKLLSELRDLMDRIMIEKSLAISAKCSEIASLKSKVSYLNGIKCYNFTCQHRIKNNPEKEEK